MKSYVLLFDIDGVLADHSGSLHHWNANDLTSFHEEMPTFPPIPAGVVLFNFLVTQAQVIGHAIAGNDLEGAEIPYIDVITARPERMREVTVNWFVENGLLAPRALHMRADDDFRNHTVIKMEMLEKHYQGKEEVLLVIEDNPQTVAAFRERGITAYQTEGATSKIVVLNS